MSDLRSRLTKLLTDADLAKNKPTAKPKVDVKALKERLRRLNVTYIAGNLSNAEYLQQDAEIKLLIAKAE